MFYSKSIELFYLFFQGILVFQVLVFTVLYFITYKRDILYYCLFLLFAALYFFLNASFTFFGIPEDDVFNSKLYEYANIPVIIAENTFYLLFLNAFYVDLSQDRTVKKVFRYCKWLIPLLILVFVVDRIFGFDTQAIFYTVKLLAVLPALVICRMLFIKELPFAALMTSGLICTIAGTLLTVFFIVLRNNNVHLLLTDGYPLIFIRLGLLGDMIFYLAAILKKWHYQEKQLSVQEFQSKLAVEQLRNKISGELHDDLGSNLSGISMYSYMTNELIQSGKYEEAKQSLDIIQRSATEMTHNLSDLVWTIKPSHDSLQELLDKLEEYAAMMAAAKDIRANVFIPENLANINLPVESRRNIYLFCKEAINNSVKYSHADAFELKVVKSNDQLSFTVNDKGKGFDIMKIKKGNGLANMQKRADEIDAVLLLQSKEQEGTFVSLTCKIT